jgi:proteasome lid subunit RPN8/RPN11
VEPAAPESIPLSQIPLNGPNGNEGILENLTLYRCDPDAEKNKHCDVIFPQSVYRTVVDHLSHDTTREHGGFLLGYESCMGEAKTPVVVITEAMPAKFTEGTPVRLTFTTDTWRDLDNEIAEKYRDLASAPQRVGWYHSHPNISIFLSHWDLDVCTTFEKRKFPVALVVDPVKNRGGFFIGGEKGYQPHSPQGFYEARNMQKESIVSWGNVKRVEPENKKTATPDPPPAPTASYLWAVVLTMLLIVASVGYLYVGQLRDREQLNALEAKIDRLNKGINEIKENTHPRAEVIEVTVTPEDALLSAAQHQDMTAEVKNSENQKVKWSINPKVAGSISSTGTYTAPASVRQETQVTVIATSLADPAKSGSAHITLRPAETKQPIVIDVRPANLSLKPSESKLFRADVTGSGSNDVTWSIYPPDRGKIDADTGLYTAPAALPEKNRTVRIIATSKTDPTKTSERIVKLVPASGSTAANDGASGQGTATSSTGQGQPSAQESAPLEVRADKTVLSEGEHAKLTATAGSEEQKEVDWSLNGGVGSIAFGEFIAPPEIKDGGDSVTITATTKGEPKRSGSVKITLTPKSAQGGAQQ